MIWLRWNHEAQQIPRTIPRIFVTVVRGIFVLGSVNANSLFQFVYTDFKTCGFPKGRCKPLSARGIQWGGERPVGTRFSCGKSSVLYLPGSAGGSKGLFSYPTDTLRGPQNSRFCEPSGLQNVGICREQNRLFGCRR